MPTAFTNAWNGFPTGYNGSSSFCGCGGNYPHHCAHLVSNAFQTGGLGITSPHNAIDGGSRCSNQYPLRAKNLRNWVRAKGYTCHSNAPTGNTVAFFYC